MGQYARVITDDPTDRELDYLIPPDWASKVHAGSRIKVPLQNRMSLATVVGVVEAPSVANPRPVAELLGEEPAFSPELLSLLRWMADYYCCPLASAIRTALPEVIRRGQKGFRQERMVSLARAPSAAEIDALKRQAPRQAEVLNYFIASGASVMRWPELQHGAATTGRTMQQLVERGWLRAHLETSDRDPFAGEQFAISQPLTLASGQQEALAMISAATRARESRPILLHGVTGSGKTEVYLQAIQHCLGTGRGALVLVPEISLTPQTVERFKMRFSSEMIAVLHSHLSTGERHDEWHRLRSGRARVGIGARSAIFAPISRLGLIVVDEEHESSYKQEDSPRYHARDLAVVRASLERCAIVLGSATPSMETFHNVQTGKYRIAVLKSRVDDRQMPLIRIVDSRQEYLKQRGASLISQRLGAAMEERLQRKEQTILFLNRRGFATSLLCSSCGHLAECPNCSIALTFHLSENRLKCHLCGHAAVAPKACPKCADRSIRYTGSGTEKLETIVRKLFPQARLARMDADSMTRKDAYRSTLSAFRSGQTDILMGTQMIAKGLDFPNVTLVGIINADIGLHLPDFRAGERTFQLLTQVAGRAGRGETSGEVIVQSATPFSPSIQYARHHDYGGFWEQEIEFRERCSYPPFVHLLLLQIRSEHQRRAEFSGETLHRRLEEFFSEEVVLHPLVPAPIERKNGAYRFQILMRTQLVRRVSRGLRDLLSQMTFPDDVFVTVDVDPQQLL